MVRNTAIPKNFFISILLLKIARELIIRNVVLTTKATQRMRLVVQTAFAMIMKLFKITCVFHKDCSSENRLTAIVLD